MFSFVLIIQQQPIFQSILNLLENLVYQRCSTIPNVRSSQLHMGILVVYLVV
jgi:hypothetical protein